MIRHCRPRYFFRHFPLLSITYCPAGVRSTSFSPASAATFSTESFRVFAMPAYFSLRLLLTYLTRAFMAAGAFLSTRCT